MLYLLTVKENVPNKKFLLCSLWKEMYQFEKILFLRPITEKAVKSLIRK